MGRNLKRYPAMADERGIAERPLAPVADVGVAKREASC
jgi:hypothetical protein